MRKYLSRVKQQLSRATRRNRPTAPAYPTVTLTHWRSGQNVPNFGDDLSPVIVSLVLAQRGHTLSDEAKRATEMLAIGSILHLAQNGATVWGSGVNGKVPDHFHHYRTLDVRAVRGPLTRAWLKREKGIDAPEVYGDPALLLPYLCGDRFSPTGEVDHVFVPNLNDLLNGVDLGVPDGVEVVSPMQSWHKVVSQILRARFVSASSLHGLVIADAFGIPARQVRLSDTENPFKYEDYYEGTGRAAVTPARTIAEAEKIGGAPAMAFTSEVLLKAFPWDLWAGP